LVRTRPRPQARTPGCALSYIVLYITRPVAAPTSAACARFRAHVQDFWSRTILGTERYTGNPFSPHIRLALALAPAHFDRWIELFKATATRVLQPVAAQRAIAKVEHMNACFQSGLFLPTPHAAGEVASPN
jgi:truncated hemoglobin YjbI